VDKSAQYDHRHRRERGLGVYPHFQQYFSYIVAVSFIGGGNGEYSEKTTDLPQIPDKIYHKITVNTGILS
jgi:hypothetical protein